MSKKDKAATEIVHDDYRFQFQCIPYHVMAERDVANGMASSYDDAIANYQGHIYGELTILPNQKDKSLQDIYELKHPKGNWEKVRNQLLFLPREEFVAFVGDTRLPCTLYHAQLSPFSHQGLTMSLVFKLPEEVTLEDHELLIHFDDKILTQQEIRFTLSASNELISLNQ